MINLDNTQKQAVLFVHDFMSSKETVAVIKGKAGTGKTTLIKYIIEDLQSTFHDFILLAPTNKAALVLEEKTDCSVKTVHSLLGLYPNYNIENFKATDLKFTRTFNKNSLFEKLIICDEGSMINDELYDTLYSACKKGRSKILYILDEAQLAPVKSIDKSKTTLCPNSFSLTKIYRQAKSNPSNNVIERLRTENILDFSSYKGLYFVESRPLLAATFLKDIRSNIDNLLVSSSKILGYRNVTVDAYNAYCHKSLFGDSEWGIGEQIIFNENAADKSYVNGQDGVVIKNEAISITLPFGLNAYPGYELQIRKVDNTIVTLNVLSQALNEKTLTKIADTLENLRCAAVKNKKQWKKFFLLYGQCVTVSPLVTSNGNIIKNASIKYGYALTVHKSQGSTYNSVYIDVNDINVCSIPEDARQLKYVAFSRTKNKIFIYQ